MRNEERWEPSKFLWNDNKLYVNKSSSFLNPQSWIITECIATTYTKYSPDFLRGEILDLGCGLCPFYPLYKGYSSSIFCIDWHNSIHASPYTDLECDITEPVPLNSASFDTVILSDVLEHISKPDKLLAEIHRLLKLDGHLILNVPFLYWVHESPYDFYRYTKFGLKFLLENAGFRIEILEPVGGLVEVWADITAKFTSYIPIIKHIAPQILFQLNSFAGKTKLIKSRFEKLDQLFPIGYFAIVRKT